MAKSKPSKKDVKTDKVPAEKIVRLKKVISDAQEIIREYHVPEDAANIRVILEKLQERLEYYIKIVTQILQPEEFHSLHECTIFDETEKVDIFELYKNMMILHRELLKADIKNDEDDMLSTLTYAHSELTRFKPQMLVVVAKMQDSWKQKGTNGRVRYFG